MEVRRPLSSELLTSLLTYTGHNSYFSPMIYTAPCVMFLMRADALLGQVGAGWALEIERFLGPVK
jgi:hypothetical protein